MNYDGLHLMIDARLKNEGAQQLGPLCDQNFGKQVLDDIVRAVDMTQILPTICVSFPHAVSEMDRVLSLLEQEGLSDSATAQRIRGNLQARVNQTSGYSAFTMIAESHITLHAFPDSDFFSFDCYSCKGFDVNAVVELLKNAFGDGQYNVHKVPRLIPSECQSGYCGEGTDQLESHECLAETANSGDTEGLAVATISEYAAEIGRLVEEKDAAYGNSYERSHELLAVLYPDGVPPSQYKNMQVFSRMFDKMFRLVTDPDAFSESPWRDMAGYTLLMARNEDRRRAGEKALEKWQFQPRHASDFDVEHMPAPTELFFLPFASHVEAEEGEG